MQRIPLSCFIITQDEADRIGRTIDCVKDWADEVVVIDSGSGDDTVKIAEAHGARVLHRAWTGYGEQKRFGEDNCRNDWLLNLDADEVLRADLAAEIRALFAGGAPQLSFYRFRLVHIYPGDSRPRPFADYHNYIRLYDRTRGRFSASAVHDEVDPRGAAVGQLKGRADHYSLRSLSHLIDKLNKSTDLQGKSVTKRRALLPLRIVIEFPVTFFKFYILRRHFTGGIKGFVFALVHATFRVVRLAKIGGIT